MGEDYDILSEEEHAEIRAEVDKLLPEKVNQKMKEMYIGYIDINGIQNMMRNSSDMEFESFCNDLATMVDSILMENKSYESHPKEKVEFHMFSDNMIFLCNNLQFLIERMGLLQMRLAVCLKLTIKGGINKGMIYKYKNQFVLGSGLVSAYKIDADYHNPAIKVERSIVDECNGYIRKVAFDEYVVDYYKIADNFSEDFRIEELPYIKKLIIENLSCEHSEDVLHKYLWMKEYHNSYCSENNIDSEL